MLTEQRYEIILKRLREKGSVILTDQKIPEGFTNMENIVQV